MVRRIALVVALTAGLILAPVTAASAAPRATKPKPVTLAVYGSFKTWVTAPSGATQGIGTMAIGTGSLTEIYGGGATVGTVTAVTRVIGRTKDSEFRDTQIEFALKGGSIFAQAVNEDPVGKRPQTLSIVPIVGGTGSYATARGTLLMQPIGKTGVFRFAIDGFVDQRMAKGRFAFAAPETSVTPSRAPQGIGAVRITHADGAKADLVLVATQIAKKGSKVTQSTDLLITAADGTLIARAVGVASSKPQRFAILGGTGVHSGSRGELTMSITATGVRIDTKIAKRAGKATSLRWFDSDRKTQTAAVVGGSLVASEGTMSAKANGKGAKRGNVNAAVLTYDDSVGGFQPVVTTLEQTFTEGTMVVTSITNAVQVSPWTRAVIGGTGDFGGASGQAVSTSLGRGQWQRSASFWR